MRKYIITNFHILNRNKPFGSQHRRACDEAWKPSDNHVDVGQLPLARLDGVHHLRDVLVDAGPLTEPFLVAPPCELLARPTVRLPLVRPDGLEVTSRGLLHARIGIPVEPYPESPDACEQLCDPN